MLAGQVAQSGQNTFLAAGVGRLASVGLSYEEKGRAQKLTQYPIPWDCLLFDRNAFFPPENYHFVDLRSVTNLNVSLSGTSYIELAAKFYMDNFNKAGEAAGIRGPWTYQHALAQMNKRLKQPGVAFLLTSAMDHSKILGGFFTELLPTIHGLRAIELDVVVDEAMRRKGMGARLTLYGYNALAKHCNDFFQDTVSSFTGETYRAGFQQQFWKHVGFSKSSLSTANIDVGSLDEKQYSLNVDINNLDEKNLATLIEFLCRDNLDSSHHVDMQRSWDVAQAMSYTQALENYLGIVQKDSPVIAYIATSKKGETVAYFIASSTIRRGGAVVLSSPFCVIDEELAGGFESSGELIKQLFHKAARDALLDARKSGLVETNQNIAGVDFGIGCNPVFFAERYALSEVLDTNFFGISVKNSCNPNKGSMEYFQRVLQGRCSKSGVRVHARDPNSFAQIPKFVLDRTSQLANLVR